MPPTDDPNNSIAIDTAPPSADFIAIVSFDSAWRNRFCAVALETHDLIVFTDDTPPSIIARTAEQLPRDCDVIRATDEEVRRLIARAYER
ncbi:MAG: hypothetical protein KF805_16555, partial [Phycisphaeraceae bacterium]|nr:hypothetical protein [Phycisphaeraceae bacterium]